jgi:hypothetical protein
LNASPRAALDALCGGDDADLMRGLDLIGNAQRMKTKPFEAIPEAELFAWCDEKPATRYPALAGRISIATNEDGAGERNWAPLALQLLARAPDQIEVLKRYAAQIRHSGGWGSTASILEANRKLFDKLPQTSDPAMKAFIQDERTRLSQDIEQARHLDAVWERKRSERFE